MEAPAGLPLVQHALLSVLEQVKRGAFTVEKAVEKVSHNPAIRYKIDKRGYVEEGFYADLVLVDPNQTTAIRHENTHYHCQWTPFNGVTFNHKIMATFVNGKQVFNETGFADASTAMALHFNRD